MDATSTKDTVETSDAGLAPSTIPGGCNDAQNGVSVENVPPQKEGYEWYVFRASYGREDKNATLTNSEGCRLTPILPDTPFTPGRKPA